MDRKQMLEILKVSFSRIRQMHVRCPKDLIETARERNMIPEPMPEGAAFAATLAAAAWVLSGRGQDPETIKGLYAAMEALTGEVFCALDDSAITNICMGLLKTEAAVGNMQSLISQIDEED